MKGTGMEGGIGMSIAETSTGRTMAGANIVTIDAGAGNSPARRKPAV
jgi:hypothetical protein